MLVSECSEFGLGMNDILSVEVNFGILAGPSCLAPRAAQLRRSRFGCGCEASAGSKACSTSHPCRSPVVVYFGLVSASKPNSKSKTPNPRPKGSSWLVGSSRIRPTELRCQHLFCLSRGLGAVRKRRTNVRGLEATPHSHQTPEATSEESFYMRKCRTAG